MYVGIIHNNIYLFSGLEFRYKVVNKTFNDLDQLLNETSNINTSFTSVLINGKSNKGNLTISSASYSSSDQDDFLDKIHIYMNKIMNRKNMHKPLDGFILK